MSESSHEMLNALLEAFYDVGCINELNPIRSDHMCRVYMIDTSRSKYIVKFLPSFLKKGDKEFRFINFLKKHQFKTPDVLPAKAGRTNLPLGSYSIEVQEFIPHDATDNLSKQQVEDLYLKAAEQLGTLHILSSLYGKTIEKPTYSFDPLKLQWYGRGLDDLLFVTPILAGQSVLHTKISAKNKDLRDFILSAVNSLAQIQQNMDKKSIQSLKIINHGDYHLGNILFQNPDIAAVIDFDFCFTESYLFDLLHFIGYALFTYNPIENSFSQQNLNLNPDLGNRVIHRYREIFPRQFLTARAMPIVIEGSNTGYDAKSSSTAEG